MAHTLRSHLAEYHAKAATHHGLLAAHHATLAKHFGKLAKAELGDGESFKAISDEHIALMKRHEDHAALHATLADKCAKAQQDWLEKTIRPDAFSSVPAQNTPDAGFGIRAVARPGSPDPERTTGLDKATLDSINPMFRHLVQTSDEV